MLRFTSRLTAIGAPRPFQRLVQCSSLPNAMHILHSDFESTFKTPLSEATDATQFLHNYIVKPEEVIPYTTTMMRVFTDIGALEDMRLLFAMAINELSSNVPEELYRIYLFSISETDTFTRDEVMNVLSLIQNTGVKLSIISKLCILDLLLKLGIDPIQHVGSIADEYNGSPVPTEDVELLLKKCDSLLNTVLLTHYNAHWATEMFNVCAKFQIAVAERVVSQVFKISLANPSLHPIHAVKAAWIILSNPKAASLNVSNDDLVTAVVRCRQWRSLEAIQSLQKLLRSHNRYDNNREITRAFTIVTMHILADLGRVTEAIKLMPLLKDSSNNTASSSASSSSHNTDCDYSPYPCTNSNGTIISETHPAYFLATNLAQLGTAAIDQAYFAITGTGGGDKATSGSESATTAGVTQNDNAEKSDETNKTEGGEALLDEEEEFHFEHGEEESEKIISSDFSRKISNENKKILAQKSSNDATSTKKGFQPNQLTTEMMDIIIAACSAAKDETRALETFNEYPNFNLEYSSDSFLHLLSAMGTNSVEAAVSWHRPAVAQMIAHNIEPNAELLRLMLSQCLEINEIDHALWVIKLNRIYKRTLDRLLTVKLCAKITAAHDSDGASFLVKVVDETKSNIDDKVIRSFKANFGL